MGSRLYLCNDAWASFNDGDRNNSTIWPKYLGHADLSAQQSTEHILITPYSLISISTPAGRFNRVRASTVLLVGSIISIRRLCVRISNCSRASLSMNGERITVYLSISVGSGTGPETRAPVCCAVSTICIAD